MKLLSTWVRSNHLAWITALALSACGPESNGPPGAPELDAIDSPTNENPLTLTGTAEAGAAIGVTIADTVFEGTAGGDGSFAVSVTLEENTTNALSVTQTVGGIESDAATIEIVHDGLAPETPTVDPVVSPTRRPSQTIRGMAEPGAGIVIRGGAAEATATADETGRFAVLVELTTTAVGTVDNDLAIVAADEAGNESAPAEVTITIDPSLPLEAPLLDDFPSVTNQAMLTLSGDAEAGVEVHISGGAVDGVVMAGDDSRFSAQVELRPNVRNTLVLFAVLAAETSVTSSAVIVHDDIAPAAPNLVPQSSPTGASVVGINGTGEPGATIRITGGAAEASGTVDEAGLFDVDVMLTLDTENELSAVAVDAATNESEARTLSITQNSALPEPVRVDPIASPTSDSTITMTGETTADVDIEITGGASTVTARTNTFDGTWSAEVTLRENMRNELRVTRPGSGVDTIVIVDHDSLAPNAPTLNAIASPTSSTTVTVSGTSEALARIDVTGGATAVSANAEEDGRFAVDVTIPAESSTTLTVIAADHAGNASDPAMVSITHSSDVPPAPQLDAPNPPPTNDPTHLVTGRVASPGDGIAVRILRDGSMIASGTSDPSSGVFAVEVTLAANTTSSLEVVSVTGTIVSSPAILTITHDDIAPDAPEASLIDASPGTCLVIATGGSVSGSMGAVEGLARVRAENVTRSSTATATATELGSFSLSLTSCTSEVVRITATDAAGNVSDPTEVTSN